MLHRGLEGGVEVGTLSRNAAHPIRPPKVEAVGVEALTVGDMASVLKLLEGNALYPIAALALATGMRRGELLALRWQDTDLGANSVKVERRLQETKAGLRFKNTKVRHGKRSISIPASTSEMLSGHRKKQLESRSALGLGRPEAGALVFCHPDGSPMSPDSLSRELANGDQGA